MTEICKKLRTSLQHFDAEKQIVEQRARLKLVKKKIRTSLEHFGVKKQITALSTKLKMVEIKEQI